jgi:hypothetical protein
MHTILLIQNLASGISVQGETTVARRFGDVVRAEVLAAPEAVAVDE